MAHVITNVGRDWIADRVLNDSFSDYINIVAVGSGNQSPSKSDTALDVEEYRGSKKESNITADKTSNTGEIRCTIKITGGTEVPAGTDIWEFGLFSKNGTLIYREVRENPVKMDSGDTKTFEFKVTATN